jgi:hypothetical protein
MEEVQQIYKFDLLNLTIGQVVQLELKKDDNIGNYLLETKSVFGSVVAGAFQITFRAKMHANDVFSFFKNHF